MKTIILSLLLFGFINAQASVKTLFHPYDPTLNEIANYILNAEESVDLALYNIDTAKTNPVIQAISSTEIQERIKSQNLNIRIIFEGYSTKEKNHQKMEKLEALGIDARYLGMSRKMHHKFATIDARLQKPVLITGSANWSLSSRRNYNENILYFENKPGITAAFQNQFDLLWSKAKEFGRAGKEQKSGFLNTNVEKGFSVFFNTENLKVTKRGFSKDSKKEGYVLTRQIVNLINNANSSIEIATTRIKLRPIYEALKSAAARGVKIDVLVTMGEYSPSYFRKRSKMKECTDIYVDKCSTSQNFSIFLQREDFPGKENVNVRIKYFDLRKDLYLQKQMHSKYLITDNNTLITGSFNWSVSAEYNHFENIILVEGQENPEILESFNNDFDRMWSMNREKLEEFTANLEDKVSKKEKINCGFEPMALSFKEIDYLLNTGRRVKSISPLKLCK